MQIRNTTLFFAGIAALILGSFVITFDLPQILFVEGLDRESYLKMEEIHQRLLIELGAGIAILASGIVLLLASLLKRFEALRQ